MLLSYLLSACQGRICNNSVIKSSSTYFITVHLLYTFSSFRRPSDDGNDRKERYCLSYTNTYMQMNLKLIWQPPHIKLIFSEALKF